MLQICTSQAVFGAPKGRTSGGVQGGPNTDPHKVFGRLGLVERFECIPNRIASQKMLQSLNLHSISAPTQEF